MLPDQRSDLLLPFCGETAGRTGSVGSIKMETIYHAGRVSWDVYSFLGRLISPLYRPIAATDPPSAKFSKRKTGVLSQRGVQKLSDDGCNECTRLLMNKCRHKRSSAWAAGLPSLQCKEILTRLYDVCWTHCIPATRPFIPEPEIEQSHSRAGLSAECRQAKHLQHDAALHKELHS